MVSSINSKMTTTAIKILSMMSREFAVSGFRLMLSAITISKLATLAVVATEGAPVVVPLVIANESV